MAPPAEIKEKLVALYRQNRMEEAIALAQSLAKDFPTHELGWQALSAAFQAQGRFHEASQAMSAVIGLRPEDPEGHNNLGVILKKLDRFDEARECYLRAIRLSPRYALAHLNLANLYRHQGNLADAVDSYRNALSCNPGLLEAYKSLAEIYERHGRLDEAGTCYAQGLKSNPENIEFRWRLAKIEEACQHFSTAESLYREVLKIKRDFPDAAVSLADVLRELGKVEEAEGWYHEAIRMKPDFAEALNKLGVAYIEWGKLAEAKSFLERAIAASPDAISAYCNLANIKKNLSEQDPYVIGLEGFQSKLSGYPLKVQSSYWFAVGSVREKLGRYDDAFSAYAEGNRIVHQHKPFDDAAAERAITYMMSCFPAKEPVRTKKEVELHKVPIFIVGMPRSGTTLLEQVLSSCEQVHGAGEVTLLEDLLIRHFPAGLHSASATREEEWLSIGQEYENELWKSVPAAKYVINKLPSNFIYAGVISRMLPHAKIIHARRDAMDTCLSCYTQLFHETMEYSYDLVSLGKYYQRYEKLMKHWHQILPEGAIIDVHYEQLVENFESETRRVLDYLQIPWDERCLRFYENRRAVLTASAVQVRSGLYSNSIQRWRRFEKHLLPLAQAIGK